MEEVAQGEQADNAQVPEGTASVSVHGSAGTSVSLAAPSLGSATLNGGIILRKCTRHALNTYYATDHLGTVRFVKTVDETGTEVATTTHDYEPFGVEITPTDACDNTHRFTGHERDAETGNDYMHFRFFSASMGRFQKPDSNFDSPAANPQGWNLYSYVKGNPVNFNDPTGHQTALQRKPWHSPPPPLEPAQIKDSKMFGDDGGNPCGFFDVTGAVQWVNHQAAASGQAAPKLNLPDQIMVIGADGTKKMVAVTFDPGANHPVTQEMQRTFISVVGTAAESGAVNSVNVSATTNGTSHANDSLHPSGNAIDINYVNGVHVGRPGAESGVRALQDAAHANSDIHRNYGPARMEVDKMSFTERVAEGLMSQAKADKQTKLHQVDVPHIHWDVEP